MQRGDLSNCKETVTWKGWAVYYWDHQHCVMLFNEKPSIYKDLGWKLDNGIILCPLFLRDCGITVKWDEGKNFYYGKRCRDGQHPPIQMTLTLPKILAEFWGLDD